MTEIIVADMPTRGFRRLGPESDDGTRFMRKVAEERHYQSEVQESAIWIRDAARGNGTFPSSYLKLLGQLPVQGFVHHDFSWVDDLESEYDEHMHSFPALSDCEELLKKASDKPDERFLHDLSSTLLLCPAADRKEFLAGHFFPTLSHRFPNATVVVIGTNYSTERRLTLLRVGNFIEVNGYAAFEDIKNQGISSVGTARNLQISAVLGVQEMLSALLGLFMPLKTHYVTGRPGMVVLILFGETPALPIDLGPYPRTLPELLSSQSFMHGEQPALSAEKNPIEGWFGRFRCNDYPGDNPMIGLISYLVDRLNAYYANRLEICNFTQNQERITFIDGFEKMLTIERIVRESKIIACTTDSAVARIMTFSILDKFQELAKIPNVQKGKTFHYFCSRKCLHDILLPAFSQLPEPWDSHFSQRATKVYDELYSSLKNGGVWTSHLVGNSDVQAYREWDVNAQQFVPDISPKPIDEFIGDYVRVIRNTHHGYISDNDKRRRFATIGSLSTGFIPDSFTELPLLLLLAEVISPSSLSGYHWIDPSTLVAGI